MEIKININELREKKIFVGTPMYGGQCHGMYTKASCDLATTATKYGMDLKFFYLFNESLITRARNYLVDEFLRSPYTHLMFIDSDINFNPQDVLALASLVGPDKPIIGGPYPKKCIAWEKVRNAVDAGLADEDPTVLEKFTGDFVFAQGIGRTDLFSGNNAEMKDSINNIFLKLDKELEVFPGHGDSDTVSNILNYNDYLKEFIDD